MGWRISCLISYNRRREQRLDAPEAVDPLAEGVLNVIVVLQAELVGVLFERYAHRPRGARLVGVVIAPEAIDGVQISRCNGAVGPQPDVPLRAQEQQHIVGLAARVLAVCLCLRAFREAEVTTLQAAQPFETPEEDALDLAAELVREKGVILPVWRLFLHRQNELAAVKAVRVVVERLQIAVRKGKEPDIHLALIALLALALQVHRHFGGDEGLEISDIVE